MQIAIKSEVAGTVFTVEVKTGQAVKPDDLIALIESMKMEIPITAPKAGIIEKVVVMPGQLIKENQIIAYLSV